MNLYLNLMNTANSFLSLVETPTTAENKYFKIANSFVNEQIQNYIPIDSFIDKYQFLSICKAPSIFLSLL